VTRTVTRATPPPCHFAAVVTGPRSNGSVCRTDRVFSSRAASLAASRYCCWNIPSAFASPLELRWLGRGRLVYRRTQGLERGTPIRKPVRCRRVRRGPRGALGVVVVHFLHLAALRFGSHRRFVGQSLGFFGFQSTATVAAPSSRACCSAGAWAAAAAPPCVCPA